MSQNIAALRLEGAVPSVGGSRCGACGEQFETPLFAIVFSESASEEYYACPKCLSKVASIPKEPEIKEAFEVKDAVEEALETEDEEPAAVEVAVEGNVEGPGNCLHHLGYLKKRPKNTPIPEECLTCSKMIDCMY